MAHMKTRSVGITTTLAAACNLVIDFLLINKVGIYAGSISTLISYFLLSLFRIINVRKFQPLKYNMPKIIFGIGWLAIMSLISYQRNIYLNLINIALAII